MSTNLINIFDDGGPVWAKHFDRLKTYTAKESAAETKAAAPKASASKDDDNDLEFEDFTKLIGELDGLPSDKNKMLKTVKQLFASAQLTGKLDQAQAQQTYLSLLSQVGAAKHSKEAYKTAAEEVTKNGGMYEPVISNDGRVYAVNNATGQAAWITAEEYAKYSDKITLVTNNDILKQRAEANEFAFNNNGLAFVQNGIGMDAVTELIQKGMQKIGSTDNAQEGYISSDPRLAGLKLLQEAYSKAEKMAQENPDAVPGTMSELMTVEGLYKAKIITKDNYNQISRALSYVWSTLPQNAKTFLKLKTEHGTEQEAFGVVSQLMLANLNQDYSIAADLQKDRAITGASIGGDSELKNTQLMLLETENAPMRTVKMFNGTSDAINVDLFTAAITKQDHAYGACSIQDLTETDLAPMLNLNNAWMGDQKLISLDNACSLDGQISTADLPVTYDEATGEYKPDFKFLQKIEQIKEQCRAKGLMKGSKPNVDDNAPAEEKQKVINAINTEFQNAGVPAYLTNQGLVNTSTYKRFAIFQGAATAQAFGKNADDAISYVQRLGSDDQDEANRITRILNAHRNEKDRLKDLTVDDWWGNDDVYKGLIFVPFKSSFLMAATSSGIHIPESRVLDIYDKENGKKQRAEYVEAQQ